MAWQDDMFALKNAGFTDAEIAAEGQRQRDELTQAGFAPKEIDEHFGVKEPDLSPIKNLFTANLNMKAAEFQKMADEGKEVPEVADSFLEALDAGFDQSSGKMMSQALRGKRVTPDMILPEDAPMFHRIASQVGMVAGDLPAMVVGTIAGGIAGSAAGGAAAGAAGSVVPVAGTATGLVAGAAAGGLIGGGAGGNALPTAIRQSLMEYYEKGEIQDFGDFWARTSAVFINTLKDGTIGGLTAGAGGAVFRSATKVAAPAVARTASIGSEIATMVTLGKTFEGEAPKLTDFTDAAILIGGMHLAGTTAGKMRQIYAKTGIKPEQVMQEAQTNPVLKQELLAEGNEIPSIYKDMGERPSETKVIPEPTPLPEAKPGEMMVKHGWFEKPLSDSQFEHIHDFYNSEPRQAEVRWFDAKSGEGTVRVLEGPLAGKTVTVHGSAFGGDKSFGQNRAFEIKGGDSVSVKLAVDSHYLQVDSLEQRSAKATSVTPDAPVVDAQTENTVEIKVVDVDTPISAQDKILSKVGEKGERPKGKFFDFDETYRKLVDRFDPIKKATEALAKGEKLETTANPYELSRMVSDAPAKAAHFLGNPKNPTGGGVLDFNTLKKTGKSFQEIISPHRSEMDGLTAYLISKRVVELEGRGINHGFDFNAAKEVVANGAKFEKAAKELVDFQNGALKYLKDSGVISNKSFNNMKAANENYVSFKRIIDDGEKVTGGTAKSPVKRIKGSDADIQNPFQSMIENLELFMTLAEKNRAKKSLVDLAEKAGDTEIIKKVPASMKAIEVKADEISKALERQGVELSADPEAFNIFRKTEKDLAPNQFEVFNNGKRIVYETAPEIAEAFKLLEGNVPAQSMLFKMARAITTMKRTAISLMPDFQMRNFMRDQITAGVFTEGGSYNPISVLGAMKDIVSKNDTYFNWLKAGGANGAFLKLTDNYLDNNVFKLDAEVGFIDKAWNVMKTPLQFMEMTSTLTEQATRLAEFKRVTKGATQGPEVFKGGMASREITIDFQRAGTKVIALNGITAFMNAQIQGLDRTGRALKTDPAGIAKKAGLAITVPSILLWYANKDDERYKEIPRWQKDLFWIIPTDNWTKESVPGEAAQLMDKAPHLVREGEGGRYEINKGVIYRIPKPQELGLLFGSLPERVLESFFQDNPDAFKDLNDTMAELVTPALMPDILAPIAEQAVNKSFFTQNQLVPHHVQGVLPEYRYEVYTSETAKQLGKMLAAVPFIGNAGPKEAPLASPVVIENYVKSWTGNMGGYALQLIDASLDKAGIVERGYEKPAWQVGEMPIVKAFTVKYPSSNSESIRTFFEEFEKSQQVLDTVKSLGKQGDLDEMEQVMFAPEYQDKMMSLSGFAEALKNQSKMIRMINKDPSMKADEKRQLIDGVYFQMIEIAKQGKKLNKEFQATVKSSQ